MVDCSLISSLDPVPGLPVQRGVRPQQCLYLCLRPPTKPTREDTIFAALRRAVTKPRAWEARKNAWISATTWRLVDKRVSALRNLAKDQALIRRLGHIIKASLKMDRRRRAEEAGAEV